MGDNNDMSYLYSDLKPPNTDHPDSAIRLASVVHRFRVPQPAAVVRFADSFSTTGRDPKTRKLMLNADDTRSRLTEGCSATTKISAERVVGDAKRYQPLIHTILLSCKVQPEQARLDEKLLFVWKSGIEQDQDEQHKNNKKKKNNKQQRKSYPSEAIMYDLVMTVATEGLGHAAAATESSVAGEFAAASREYAAAAGIFAFLANDQLPKWISKGRASSSSSSSSSSSDANNLPAECHAPMAHALQLLFQANGQQMAVATLLIKEGTPNYSLLAKLCLGIAEKLQEFIAGMRRQAFDQMNRLDHDFLTLTAFQIAVQKSLSLYFQARALWENQEHGYAIALLSESTVALRTRDTVVVASASASTDGVPDVTRSVALLPLQKELEDLRQHLQFVLHHWEKDNSSVYFESVPQHVPAGKKLQEGIQMNKMTKYELEQVEPVLLYLPEGALQRTDSDLARELQERLNAGDD